MKPMFFKTRAHLMICTDARCADRGSKILFQSVWKALEDEGLAYYKTGGNLRLTTSGCLGACQFGPTMACYFKTQTGLQEAWYHHLDRDQILNVARTLHADLEPPSKGRYSD
jgi:(2Fe-2S) ferredoxin